MTQDRLPEDIPEPDVRNDEVPVHDDDPPQRDDNVELEPGTLHIDIARGLAKEAAESDGDVDKRFQKLAAWAPDIDWDALRKEVSG